jgi:hypothetical protein
VNSSAVIISLEKQLREIRPGPAFTFFHFNVNLANGTYFCDIPHRTWINIMFKSEERGGNRGRAHYECQKFIFYCSIIFAVSFMKR